MLRMHQRGVYLTGDEWSEFERCCGMYSRQMLMVAAAVSEEQE